MAPVQLTKEQSERLLGKQSGTDRPSNVPTVSMEDLQRVGAVPRTGPDVPTIDGLYRQHLARGESAAREFTKGWWDFTGTPNGRPANTLDYGIKISKPGQAFWDMTRNELARSLARPGSVTQYIAPTDAPVEDVEDLPLLTPYDYPSFWLKKNEQGISASDRVEYTFFNETLSAVDRLIDMTLWWRRIKNYGDQISFWAYEFANDLEKRGDFRGVSAREQARTGTPFIQDPGIPDYLKALMFQWGDRIAYEKGDRGRTGAGGDWAGPKVVAEVVEAMKKEGGDTWLGYWAPLPPPENRIEMMADFAGGFAGNLLPAMAQIAIGNKVAGVAKTVGLPERTAKLAAVFEFQNLVNGGVPGEGALTGSVLGAMSAAKPLTRGGSVVKELAESIVTGTTDVYFERPIEQVLASALLPVAIQGTTPKSWTGLPDTDLVKAVKHFRQSEKLIQYDDLRIRAANDVLDQARKSLADHQGIPAPDVQPKDIAKLATGKMEGLPAEIRQPFEDLKRRAEDGEPLAMSALEMLKHPEAKANGRISTLQPWYEGKGIDNPREIAQSMVGRVVNHMKSDNAKAEYHRHILRQLGVMADTIDEQGQPHITRQQLGQLLLRNPNTLESSEAQRNKLYQEVHEEYLRLIETGPVPKLGLPEVPFLNKHQQELHEAYARSEKSVGRRLRQTWNERVVRQLRKLENVPVFKNEEYVFLLEKTRQLKEVFSASEDEASIRTLEVTRPIQNLHPEDRDRVLDAFDKMLMADLMAGVIDGRQNLGTFGATRDQIARWRGVVHSVGQENRILLKEMRDRLTQQNMDLLNRAEEVGLLDAETAANLKDGNLDPNEYVHKLTNIYQYLEMVAADRPALRQALQAKSEHISGDPFKRRIQVEIPEQFTLGRDPKEGRFQKTTTLLTPEQRKQKAWEIQSHPEYDPTPHVLQGHRKMWAGAERLIRRRQILFDIDKRYNKVHELNRLADVENRTREEAARREGRTLTDAERATWQDFVLGDDGKPRYSGHMPTRMDSILGYETLNPLSTGKAVAVDEAALAKLAKTERGEELVRRWREPKPEDDMLLPTPVYNTLHQLANLHLDPGRRVASIHAKATRAWKQWVLLNPLQIAGYNLKNGLGDTARAMVSNWMIPSEMRQAWSEMLDYHFTRKTPSDLVKDMRDRGVISAGRHQEFQWDRTTIEKLPEVLHELEGFVRNAVTGEIDTKLLTRWLKKAPQIPLGYFNLAQNVSQFRESLLRSSAYMYALKQLESGGTIKFTGAANQRVFNILAAESGHKDAAAYFSRKAIGDYGDLPKVFEWARDTALTPFISFRYVSGGMLENGRSLYRAAKSGSTEAAGKLFGTITGKAVGQAAGILASTGTAAAWIGSEVYNNMFHKDELERMTVSQKQQTGIILGTMEDGSTVNTIPAFEQFTELLRVLGIPEMASFGAEAMLRGRDTSWRDFWDEGNTAAYTNVWRLLGPAKDIYRGIMGIEPSMDPGNVRFGDWKDIAFGFLGLQAEKRAVGGMLGTGETMRDRGLKSYAMGLAGLHRWHVGNNPIYITRDWVRDFKKDQGEKTQRGAYPASAVKVVTNAYEAGRFDRFQDAVRNYFQADPDRTTADLLDGVWRRYNPLTGLDTTPQGQDGHSELDAFDDTLTPAQKKLVLIAQHTAHNTYADITEWVVRASALNDPPESHSRVRATVREDMQNDAWVFTRDMNKMDLKQRNAYLRNAHKAARRLKAMGLSRGEVLNLVLSRANQKLVRDKRTPYNHAMLNLPKFWDEDLPPAWKPRRPVPKN